mgnify:CR=1 FL=1
MEDTLQWWCLQSTNPHKTKKEKQFYQDKLYNKNAQKAEHKIDGNEYILMSVNEVMSIVRDK